LCDVKIIVAIEKLPTYLILNWDQTGIKYVSVSEWRMDKHGSKKIEITGAGDKCQITTVFSGTLSGIFLPLQIIYKGKMKGCLSSVDFPEDWHIIFTQNHWANESTVKDCISKVIVSYVANKKKELKLLFIIDNFSSQYTDDVLQLLETHSIDTVLVPPNCNGTLNPWS